MRTGDDGLRVGVRRLWLAVGVEVADEACAAVGAALLLGVAPVLRHLLPMVDVASVVVDVAARP